MAVLSISVLLLRSDTELFLWCCSIRSLSTAFVAMQQGCNLARELNYSLM